jgi:hypothetical protein
MKFTVLNIVLAFLLSVSETITLEAQGSRVDFSTIPKSGTVLFYAHQDDDVIWMLPFWKITEKFVEAAMPSAPSYRTIISQQQSFINSNGYNILYESNWYTPWDDVTDREYTEYYLGANTAYNYLLNDHLETRLFTNTAELSRTEINKIKAKIEQYFADPSMSRAITHNNWGEYGHRHHMGVNKAVRELAVKYRKDVWMLGCNNSDFIDVTVPNGITWAYGSFNTPDLYTSIRNIYINNGRWTWYTDRVPSGDHKFIKIVDAGNDKSNILKGDAITTPGPVQLEPGAYIFDGDDDYMTLKGNNYSSFTILMRIRPDQIKAMDISAMSEYPTAGKNDRNFYLNSDGRISARIYDGSSKTVTSSTAISAGTWTNIAMTGNGNNLKLYVNGILDKTISTGTAITNYSTPELVLGQATQTGSYFKGQINNVRMYNRVLSDDEIGQINGKGYTITASAGPGGDINPSGSMAVSAGTDLSLSISANSGYQIADIKVDNSSVGVRSTYRFSNITSNHTISATFRRIAYTITANAGSGGSISPKGTVSVNNGSDQIFTIIPAKGYKVKDVKVDNSSVGLVDKYTFTDVTSNHTISAEYSQITYNLRSSAGQGGTISPAGIVTITDGNDQSYAITPDKGYQIEDVLVDNVSVGIVSTYSFTDIGDNHTITAVFHRVTFTIKGVSGTGGSLSPSGNIKVNYGSDLHFTISPDYGFKLLEIFLDGLQAEGDSGDFTLENITSDHNLSVLFSRVRTYSIYAAAGRNGSITPIGNSNVFAGSDQTYIITPSFGYRILNVIVDTASLGPIPEYTFTNVSNDHALSAVFASDIKADVYPNPFFDEFKVNIRSPFEGDYEISIVTLTYKTVFEQSNIPANTTISLKPDIFRGPYILNVLQKGKVVTSVRLIKY